MCGLRDDAFRRSYFRDVRSDGLILLETNCCSAAEETAWAAEWGDQAFWASQYRDPSTQSLSSHRGVTILVRGDAFGDGRVLTRDPDGRYLAILIPIYGRLTVLIAFHADCGPSHAASFSRLRDSLTIPPSAADVHLFADTNVCPCPIDHLRYSHAPSWFHTRGDDPAALASLTAALGGLVDAFRSLHPNTLEYTYTHRHNNTVTSKSRIDQHFLGPGLLSGLAPRLCSVTHLSPSCYALQRVRGTTSHTSQCSDHSAVRSVVAYSDTPRPPAVWHLPLHLLRSATSVNALRSVVDRSLTRTTASTCPVSRVRSLLADVRTWARDQVATSGREHRIRRDALLNQLFEYDAMLGEGVGPAYHIASIPDPILRAAQHAEYTSRRDLTLTELADLKAAEDLRWLLDHNYDTDVYGETCRREFFARLRAAERADSFMPAVSVAPSDPDLPVRTYRAQKHINEAADRFYGSVPGGLFNLPFEPDLPAEAALFAALRDDGKVLPASHRGPLASFSAIVNRGTVEAAITGLSLGSVPGCDGFPTEFFRLFVVEPPEGFDEDDPESPAFAAVLRARRVTNLLVDMFRSIYDAQSFPPEWNVSTTTLIHKKGPRTDLSNYRPISVCPILYKILARCLADALQHALPWVLDSSQVACQRGRSCFSNCRYIQDLIHYTDCAGTPGLLLFTDATKAFDRVQHDFLLRTMAAMQIPDPFIDLFTLLLTDATTRIKVNGFLGRPIALRNGVRQGDPCAALAFLLSLQPYLSLVSCCIRAPRSIPLASGGTSVVKLEGIPIPTADGLHTTCRPTAAMADDVATALRDTLQLPSFKLIMAVHERASGALNNWLKTFGLRVGSLRGSSVMPPDWDATHINFTADVIRYLGIFTGTPTAVLAQWLSRDPGSSDLTSRMQRRIALWVSLGVGPTYAGRNLIVKNSVLAMAWFLTEAQTLPDISHILTRWQNMAWSFIESSLTSLRTICFDSPAPTAHHISRPVLVQDYAEGGRRCVDVELFVRALRARAVRALFEPGDHPYRLLVYHWIRTSYPFYNHHPSTLLLSNCDFSHLSPLTPPFWREALLSWGSLGNGICPSPPLPKPIPLQPTYQMCCPLPPFDDGLWHRQSSRRDGTSHSLHLSTVLSLPLAFNPLLAGCLGAPVRDPVSLTRSNAHGDRSTRVRLLRPPSAECSATSTNHLKCTRQLAERGLTHVVHLLTLPSAGSPMRYLTCDEIARVGARSRNDSLPRWICSELLASVPLALRTVIDEAISLSTAYPSLTLERICSILPLAPGTWVEHRHTHALHCITAVSFADQSRLRLPPLPSYQLAAAHVPQPDGCLVVLPADDPRHLLSLHPLHHPPASPNAPPSHVHPVTVWTTTRLPHCQEQRSLEDRDPKSHRSVTLYGGPASDRSLLFADAHAAPLSLSPTLFSTIPHPTDRTPPPKCLSSLDVFSIYHLLLTYRHIVPRSLNPDAPLSSTSTSHAHLLSVPDMSLAAVRSAVCKASHPDPRHGYLTSHALYMTTHDAHLIGNGRCLKRGPTRAHCDICWHVDRTLRRELCSHVLYECPYSRLVVDPIVRSLAITFSTTEADRTRWSTCSSAELIDAFSLLLRTGCPAGLPVPVPALVAANVAGCLSAALFSRSRSNAPHRVLPTKRVRIHLSGVPRLSRDLSTLPIPPPDPGLSFDARITYARFIALLTDRCRHVLRFERSLDDNLIVLHPGIEEWLVEHGNEADWHKCWPPLYDGHSLTIPTSLDLAPVGCSGALGTTHLPLLVLPRLSVRRQPGSPTPHVYVRLSLGRRVGSFSHDPADADPSDESWPLPDGTPPEYAVDRITAERTLPSGVTQYRVQWKHYSHRTWEPSDALASTSALDTWLLRPRGPFTITLRGDISALDCVLDIPHLKLSRVRNLRSLRMSMDSHGVILLQPHHPSSASNVEGGRTTYSDSRDVGNVFLTCHPPTRAFVFGQLWDEIDISRSHINTVFGCWDLTGRPATHSLMRFRSDQPSLERDISAELALALPACENDLHLLLSTTSGVPSRAHHLRIIYGRKAIAKCLMEPKQILSAMINTRNPYSWRATFHGHTYPVLNRLLSDILTMRASVLSHPLCSAYATALASDGVAEYRRISLCLGHLDDAALMSAAASLRAAGCLTGPTINDSLLILKHSPLDPPSILRHAISASSGHVQYPVTFSFLPGLVKPDAPRPTLASLAADLCSMSQPASTPPSHASSRSPSPPPDAPSAPLPPSPARPPSPLPLSSPLREPDYDHPYSPSPPASPCSDHSDVPTTYPAQPPPASPPPPAAPLPVALPPPPSLQPIGLACDDPHLQRMINFRSRGLTRFAYPWRAFPHLARPSLLFAPSRPAPARPLRCPPPSTVLPALNSQPTPTTSTRCAAPAAPSPPQPPPIQPSASDPPPNATPNPPHTSLNRPVAPLHRPRALRPLPPPFFYPPVYTSSINLRSRPPPPRHRYRPSQPLLPPHSHVTPARTTTTPQATHAQHPATVAAHHAATSARSAAYTARAANAHLLSTPDPSVHPHSSPPAMMTVDPTVPQTTHTHPRAHPLSSLATMTTAVTHLGAGLPIRSAQPPDPPTRARAIMVGLLSSLREHTLTWCRRLRGAVT